MQLTFDKIWIYLIQPILEGAGSWLRYVSNKLLGTFYVTSMLYFGSRITSPVSAIKVMNPACLDFMTQTDIFVIYFFKLRKGKHLLVVDSYFETLIVDHCPSTWREKMKTLRWSNWQKVGSKFKFRILF